MKTPSRLLVKVFALLLPVILAGYGFENAQQDNPKAMRMVAEGDSLMSRKLYDSAHLMYVSAAQLFADASDPVQQLSTLTKAGATLTQGREIDRAIRFFKEHLPLAEQLDPLSKETEEYYNAFQEAYYYRGDPFGALVYESKVYDINVARGDTDDDKMTELNRVMGVLYFNSGQLNNAITYYTRYAEAIQKKKGDSYLTLSDAYNYLGIVYRYMGEYDLSLSYFGKAIETAERYTREERIAISPRFASVAPLYNNVGNIYHDLKDDKRALDYSLKAKQLREEAGEANHPGMASINVGLAITYSRMGRFDEAIAAIKKAGELDRKTYGDNHGVLARSLNTTGDVYLEMKNYPMAKYYYDSALVINLNMLGPSHPNTGNSYWRIGLVQLKTGDYDLALENTQKSIATIIKGFDGSSRFDNPDVTAFCDVRLQLLEDLSQKANILQAMYDQKKSTEILNALYDTYSAVVTLTDIIRTDFVDSRSKLYLAEHVKNLYERAIETSLTLYGQTNDKTYQVNAFQVMEKNKSRLLLESIQDSQLKQGLDLPDSIFNIENGIKSRLAFFEKQLLDEEVKSEKDSVLIGEIQQDIFQTRRELEQLTNSFKENYPRYHLAKYANAEVSPVLIQKKLLSENELMLEFFAGDSAVYMACIDKNDFTILKLDTVVNGLAIDFLQAIRDRDTQPYVDLASKLYEKTVQPALQQGAKHYDKIVIVPDGPLAFVPFELLLTKPAVESDYRTLPYAIHDFTFDYKLSAVLALSDFEKPGRHSTELLGFAPEFTGAVVAMRGIPGNIPYAVREVEDIATTFPGKVFVGQEATESNFRKMAGNYSIIHLATHAVMDEKNPNLSRLYFTAADTTDDGMLYAYELFNLHFNADLVTLSACNTAVGQWKEGEGAMSLSRAFTYAGCPSVVTSLWPAQDQTTAAIMKTFYGNLSKGLKKDEALRQAKLSFLASSDKIKSDPFFWGGFILVGNTDAVKSDKFTVMLIVGGIILISGFIGFTLYRRRSAGMKAA